LTAIVGNLFTYSYDITTRSVIISSFSQSTVAAAAATSKGTGNDH